MAQDLVVGSRSRSSRREESLSFCRYATWKTVISVGIRRASGEHFERKLLHPRSQPQSIKNTRARLGHSPQPRHATVLTSPQLQVTCSCCAFSLALPCYRSSIVVANFIFTSFDLEWPSPDPRRRNARRQTLSSLQTADSCTATHKISNA